MGVLTVENYVDNRGSFNRGVILGILPRSDLESTHSVDKVDVRSWAKGFWV